MLVNVGHCPRRMDCNHAKRVSALLLYMIHEDHMAASVHLLTIMLADK